MRRLTLSCLSVKSEDTGRGLLSYLSIQTGNREKHLHEITSSLGKSCSISTKQSFMEGLS